MVGWSDARAVGDIDGRGRRQRQRLREDSSGEVRPRSEFRSWRGGRITDERPGWDTFPWWSVIIIVVLVWMGGQIIVNDDYGLAWERIIPGLGLTLRSTIYAFGIALGIALIAGTGQMSRNVVIRNLARTYVEFVRGIPMPLSLNHI